MTLEFDYWLAAETCGKTADLTEQFAFTENATACIPASPHSDGGLAAELSVRWSAKSCGLGGFLEMWQTRTCTGTLLSNATVPAGQQGGSCINFSPGKSGMSRCNMQAPPAPAQNSSNVGVVVAGALCAVLVAGGLLVYRKKKMAGGTTGGTGSDEPEWMQRHFGSAHDKNGEPAKDIADSDYAAGTSAAGTSATGLWASFKKKVGGARGGAVAGKNDEEVASECDYAALENDD
jgi:LPXTG-motif cell wall-anchored protein